MPPATRIQRRYFVELSLAVALYFAAIFGRIFLLPHMDDRLLAMAIRLLPILAVGLIGVAIFRFYRGVDEFHRLRVLKVAAITAGVTAASVGSWNFLTDVGVPPLNNFAILMFMAGTFSLAGFLFRVEDAYSDGRIGGFVRSLTWPSTLLFAGGLAWTAVANDLGQPLAIPLAVVACTGIIGMAVSFHIGPSNGLV